MKKQQWHTGCSGFSYREWKDVFYPTKLPQRSWFEFYATQFDTLELNVTFYRFPQVKTLLNWYEKAPAHFLFAVKVPKLITHLKQLNECEGLLNDFYTTCKEGLKEKLGPVLFQFPPKFAYTEERMQKIIASIQKGFINVVEFRHSSWWCEEVYTQLKKHKIIFCGHSYPGLPDEVIATASVLYYRFHGVPRLYYSQYSEEKLATIADTILAKADVKKVYCFFNNTAAVGAIDNARWIQQYAKEQLSKKK